ncbi:tripartite tricarboxylate transporter substrate-binding protein [Variovorax humicola]|uniref:Tripartite tricarboxylate transporter substrate-binding protein n=1 Tax=Variovorax humicola TaxID=1769758 RepID=A0ABU8VZS9_9BURK
MTLNRRQFTACLGASAIAGLPGISFAQNKTLRVLVGYAAGGAADTVARAVSEGLRESGYTAIVDNKVGAAGRLATEALLTLPPDGNTLLMTPLGNLTLYPHIFKALRYDPLKDFAAVGTASSMSFALAVGADSPVKTLQEFLALAAKDPKFAAYGTPGAGTAMHFLGAMLGKDAKLNLTHVAYKGGSAALTDVIGGSLPCVITTTPNLLQMHRAGKIRILAISEATPNAALPGVPTFKSAGFPDLVITESFAFFARTGTPPATLAQLGQAVASAVKAPAVTALLKKAEYEPLTMTPEALDKQVRADYASWGRIAKAVGYTPED